MAVFKVYRNREYQASDFMYGKIREVWEQKNCIRKYKSGIAGSESIDIYNAFNFSQTSLGKDPIVKLHMFEIDFEGIQDMNLIDMAVRKMLDYISQDFQCIGVVVPNTQGGYKVQFLLNAVSPATGKCFHDNNRTYIELRTVFQNMIGQNVGIELLNGTIFDGNTGLADSYRY